VSLQSCLTSGGARSAFPGSADYNHARVEWNARQLYKPAAFVFPTTVAQVQHALTCSLQVGVGIVPRGGGHSFEDYSLGKGRDLSYHVLNWNWGNTAFLLFFSFRKYKDTNRNGNGVIGLISLLDLKCKTNSKG